MDYTKAIRDYLALEIETLNKLDVTAVNDAMNLIMKAYSAKKNIYIMGNGGSSATASHYQNDFNKGISEYVETKFRFVCLNDNVATLMAIANDIGFEEVFLPRNWNSIISCIRSLKLEEEFLPRKESLSLPGPLTEEEMRQT